MLFRCFGIFGGQKCSRGVCSFSLLFSNPKRFSKLSLRFKLYAFISSILYHIHLSDTLWGLACIIMDRVDLDNRGNPPDFLGRILDLHNDYDTVRYAYVTHLYSSGVPLSGRPLAHVRSVVEC
jgi:hypothetical protein